MYVSHTIWFFQATNTNTVIVIQTHANMHLNKKQAHKQKLKSGKIILTAHFKLSKSMQPPAIGEKRTLANINCLSRFKYACNFYALIKNIP